MLRATRSLPPARPRLVALGLQLHVRTMAKKGRGPTNNSSNVVTMHGLKKVLPGGRVLLENVNLKLTAGAKVGVLGANGAGKSSFLRVLAGWDAEVEGEHWIREGLKVGMLEQEPRLDDERDVLSNIMDGVGEQRDALARFEAVNLALAQAAPEQMDELVERQAEVMAELEVLDCWDLDSQIKAAMHALNCPPGDAMPGPLSGGQKRRVALCRLLVSKPDLMMLDEPTNHLDASSVQWLEGYLERYKGSVVAVTRRRWPRPHSVAASATWTWCCSLCYAVLQPPAHGVAGDARPILPRQRRGLDPRGGQGAVHAVPGQLHGVARAQGITHEQGGRAGAGALPGHHPSPLTPHPNPPDAGGLPHR